MQKLTALCNKYGIRDDINLRMLLLNQKEVPYFADEFERYHHKFGNYVDSESFPVLYGDGETSTPKIADASELRIFKDIHPKLFKTLEITLIAGMYFYAVESFRDEELGERLWEICQKIERTTLKYAKKNQEHAILKGRNIALVNDIRTMLVTAGLIDKAEGDIFDQTIKVYNLSWAMYQGAYPLGTKFKFYTPEEFDENSFKYIDVEYLDDEKESLGRSFAGSVGVVYEAYQRCKIKKTLKDSEEQLNILKAQLKSKTKAEDRLVKKNRQVDEENKRLKEKTNETAKAKELEYKGKLLDLQTELFSAQKEKEALKRENEILGEKVREQGIEISQHKSQEIYYEFVKEIVERESEVEIEQVAQKIEYKNLTELLKGYRVLILGGHERWRIGVKEHLDGAQVHNVLVEGYNTKRKSNDLVIFNICSMSHADFNKIRNKPDFQDMYFTACRGISRFASIIKDCLDR